MQVPNSPNSRSRVLNWDLQWLAARGGPSEMSDKA